MTITEVADQLAVHRATLERWIARGDLTVIRMGRTVRIDARELRRFVTTRTQRAGTKIAATRGVRVTEKLW